MRLCVVIVEEEPAMRQFLSTVCARRDYEVLTFSDPGLCPLYISPPGPCPRGTVCADHLLVDLLMPEVDGLDFAEGLLAQGCPAPQIALMSGAWPPAAHARAARLGCCLFTKPFAVAELLAWFDTAEAQVAPTRALLEWQAHGWRLEPPAPGDRG